MAVFALLPAVADSCGFVFILIARCILEYDCFHVVSCGLMAAYRVVALRDSIAVACRSSQRAASGDALRNRVVSGHLSAYAGSHASQVRSTEGRIGIWTRSLELMHSHGLWGVGSSNAALSLISSADQEETTGFASRAFSLPIQVLAEKG